MVRWWTAAGVQRPSPTKAAPPLGRRLGPLRRIRLTDGVARTLFEEYAAHRTGTRGEEETGWAILGLRDGDDALALASLPAGANREAGQAHVRFNSDAQALASRIVRQTDRRLTLLGVAHTHPGRLRHPSDGDYRGDSQWVRQLRGGEGVFGIGTADAPPGPAPEVAWQPRPNRQCLGDLSWCWYALGEGDSDYRPLPVEVTLGPDLAQPLRAVWDVIEVHAERLDRIARQQAGVDFDVVEGKTGPALVVTIPLAGPAQNVQVVMEGKTVRYLVQRDGVPHVADLPEPRIDHGLYLLLADLAGKTVNE